MPDSAKILGTGLEGVGKALKSKRGKYILPASIIAALTAPKVKEKGIITKKSNNPFFTKKIFVTVLDKLLTICFGMYALTCGWLFL